MNIEETPLSGLKVITLDTFKDQRGFFIERFNPARFESLGLPTLFYQDNHSRSVPGVLRGLHFQTDPQQGKLVSCLRGRIWDVAVDIRADSPTFKKYFGIELNDENSRVLWIPEGFAHGFCVLGNEPADVLYKTTTPYNPKTDTGILWNDPSLSIRWPIENPMVSDKDRKLPVLV